MDIKKSLQRIKKEGGLRAYVADEILNSMADYGGVDSGETEQNHKEQAKEWFNDLQQGGVAGGMIGGLNYYTDTKKFYIKHLEEIEELQDDYKDETGEELAIGSTPRYNFLAWFAFEETARKMASELGIDN